MAIVFLNTYFLEDLWDVIYLSQNDKFYNTWVILLLL